jgi:hypothetical protein
LIVGASPLAPEIILTVVSKIGQVNNHLGVLLRDEPEIAKQSWSGLELSFLARVIGHVSC